MLRYGSRSAQVLVGALAFKPRTIEWNRIVFLLIFFHLLTVALDRGLGARQASCIWLSVPVSLHQIHSSDRAIDSNRRNSVRRHQGQRSGEDDTNNDATWRDSSWAETSIARLIRILWRSSFHWPSCARPHSHQTASVAKRYIRSRATNKRGLCV